MDIEYVTGDATAPRGSGPRIIAHVCNDVGAWGRGFVLAVSRRWRGPEAAYRRWYATRPESGFALGAIWVETVAPDLWVANMIAQRGLRGADGMAPIRYDALARCLAELAEAAVMRGASVHMPRIGCGLAGGRWERVEPLIREALCARGVSVTVYELT